MYSTHLISRNLHNVSEPVSSFVHLLLAIGIFVFSSCSHVDNKELTETEVIYQQVEATQATHGLSAWWEKEVVQADVEIEFGGKVVVEGTFSFEANGPKARYDRKDGVTIIYDGRTAWMLDPAGKDQKARFHVLTWPWFIMAPFKMQGEGITLSEYKTARIDGKRSHLIKQSFAQSMGDAPDDWYRFIINARTNQIDAMAYIVTYGVDIQKANQKPSVIRYFDYKDFDGTLVSTRYDFWYWDDQKMERTGDEPKARGKVENLRYIKSDPQLFRVPSGALELNTP